MRKITDIKEQVKNKKRVSVYLDGEYYCGLDLVTAVKNRLKVGQLIEEATLVQIQYDSEMQACFDRALTFISDSFDIAALSEVFSSHPGLMLRQGDAQTLTYRMKRGEDPLERALDIVSVYTDARASEKQ